MPRFPINPSHFSFFHDHADLLLYKLQHFEYRSGFIQRLKDGYGIIHTPRRTLPYANANTELLLSLFSDNKMFDKNAVQNILGEQLVDHLISDGFFVLNPDNSNISSTFRIIPVNQFLIFIPFRQFNEPPVYIGADSLTFTRHIQYSGRPKNVLDLATGSGFQLFNLPWQDGSITMKGFDVNPNAIKTGLLNVSVNKTPWINFEEKNIESDLSSLEEQYDLVIGNPPIIPTPDSEVIKTRLGGMIHADGGRDGFSVIRNVLHQIDAILTKTGSLQLILCSLGNAIEPYIIKELNTLLQKCSLTGNVVVIKKIPVELDAYYRGQKDIKEYQRWMKFYNEEKATYWYRLILRVDKIQIQSPLKLVQLLRNDFSKFPNTEKITVDTIKPKINYYLADTILQNRPFEDIKRYSVEIERLIENPNWKVQSIRDFGVFLFEKLPDLFKTEGAAVRFWGQCTNEFWWKPKYLERVLW